MKPDLFKEVVLTQSFPEEGLREGDIAVVVNYNNAGGNGDAAALLELPRSFGDAFSFVTVPVSAIAPFEENQSVN